MRPPRWFIYCIDPDLKKQTKLGSIVQTREAVSSLIGHRYEYEGQGYVIIAAFALSPGQHLVWHPSRNRYIHDHEIHCLRIPPGPDD